MDQIIVTHLNGTTLKLQSRANTSTIKKATQNVELLGADIVDITVESAKKLVFSIGDKIIVIGREYTMNIPATERKISESSFVYDLQFEGVQYDMLRASYSVNVDTTSNAIQDINGDSLTGDLKRFLDVLIANLNRVFPNKWLLGTYPLNTETRTETFSDSDNCLSVLQSLCGEDKYNTEFSISIAENGTRTLKIGATGTLHTYTFEYGKSKGIYELTRQKVSSSNIITRLNVFGSSKNISTRTYRSSKLCLPAKNKAQSFLESADSITKYGLWEYTKNFDNIYPHRTGTISSLGDSSIKFVDSSMNFDLNAKDGDGNTLYLIPGSNAKIHFNTGKLAGYEFEITKYNNTTKEFTVIAQTDENGYTFPSPDSSAFQFDVGDKYVIVDIYMPQSYIDTAEAELAVAGQDYLDKYCQPKVSYGLTVDSFFLKDIVGADAESNIIWAGDYIPIKDADLDVDKTIRVKGFNRDLLQDYSYSLTIADLAITVSTINRVIAEMKGVENIVKINDLADPAKARRNYLAAQEVLNMIFDPEGDFYTDKIKPLSIDTTMLSVGAKSMQFSLAATIIQPNYAGEKNRVVSSEGMLAHYTILDSEGDPRLWSIQAGDVTLSTDGAYLMYARCSRTSGGGSLLFSTTNIPAESDPDYYHFLIGVINSAGENNERAVALMYGFTTINGRFIKTGRIQSADGVTYFDLDTGEFKGNFKFTSGTSVETAVNNALNNASAAQTTANNAASTASSAASVASSAQSSASSAITQIADIVSDNILSKAEKPSQRQEWNVIAAEKTGINSQAITFSITTENTAYNNAYQALATYLNAGTTYTSGVPSWLSDANLGTDTVIVGSTYRSNWETFFTARTTLLNAIAAKAKTLADAAQTQANTATTNAATAQTAANNAQSSATTANALIADIASDGKLTAVEKSSIRAQWDAIASEKTKNDTQADTFSITTEKTAYGTAFQALATYLNAGVTWSSGIPSWISDANLGTTTDITGSTFRSKFKDYYDARTTLLNAIAAKAKEIADSKPQHFVAQPVAPYRVGDLWTDTNVLLRCKTTRLSGSFSAAEWEDATKYDNTKTTIDGGLVTSGTMQVAGDEASILAGITGNGTVATSVRFWAGSTYANRATAPFRVLQNGKMYATDAEISGTITATSGAIGGFTISASQLSATSGSDEMILSASLIRFHQSSDNTWVYIGGDVIPPSSGGALVCPMRIEVSRTISPDYGYANAGIYFNITGVANFDDNAITGNHALYIENGDICGFRLRVRRISASTTLSHMDSIILAIPTSTLTLYLPATPRVGQVYFIRRCTVQNIVLNANGNYISAKDNASKGASLTLTSWSMAILVWDHVNDLWWSAHTASM
ncbi:hypothetical protein JZU61_04560 [bacterium]|nr:hypothetical protein [bacterium]